jgi:hypothetical protein
MGISFRSCNEAAARCLRKITGRYYATSAKPELTSIRYKVRRGPYATVTDADIRFFDSLLGSNRFITDPDECEKYNIDFPKTVRGKREKKRRERERAHEKNF